MSRISGQLPPSTRRRRRRRLAHGLVVFATGLCFSLPIALMLLLASPLYTKRPDLTLLDVEAVALAVAAALIGTAFAAYAHRDRRRRDGRD